MTTSAEYIEGNMSDPRLVFLNDNRGDTLEAEAVCDPVKLDKALAAWARWYSRKLDRIANRGCGADSVDYSGYEQDLFEALGCYVPDEPKSPV